MLICVLALAHGGTVELFFGATFIIRDGDFPLGVTAS